MKREELVALLRRSRAVLDAILGLEGYEAKSYVEAIRDSGEDLAEEIHIALLGERDPGGARVRSAISDQIPVQVRAELDARLRAFESEHDRPLRIDPNPATAREALRGALLDAILFATSAEDKPLALLLSFLLADLAEHRRVQ